MEEKNAIAMGKVEPAMIRRVNWPDNFFGLSIHSFAKNYRPSVNKESKLQPSPEIRFVLRSNFCCRKYRTNVSKTIAARQRHGRITQMRFPFISPWRDDIWNRRGSRRGHAARIPFAAPRKYLQTRLLMRRAWLRLYVRFSSFLSRLSMAR